MKRFLILFTAFLTAALSLSAQSQPAFPGAVGFGRLATGGRAGSVYHVTNLNDSGSGSLRDAVSSPHRIVVFDVAGVIQLQSRLVFSHHLYVAGQTAPGEGITVYGNGVSFSGADNTIVRYLRFRMGAGGDSGKDAAGIANGTNMIFDHISVSWGLDETFSINSDGKGDLGDITIQNSIIAQGLMDHSAGGLIQADNITLYRNLYADNSTRNNKIKGRNQYVNCIVYNWKNGCYLMGGDSEGTSYCNATNNLFINGPAVGGNAFTGGNSNFHLYAEDNWQDKNRNGIFDPYAIPHSEYSGGPTFHDVPFDYPELPAYPGNTLIDSLLPNVGCSLPYRDIYDFYVADEVLSYGKAGHLIARETQLPIPVPSAWNCWTGTTRDDSDGDGMPDEWEQENGTDPAVNDAMTLADNGYANIENYINSIAPAYSQPYLREPYLFGSDYSTQTAIVLSWRDYTEGEEAFVIEQLTDGEYKEIGRTKAGETSFKVAGLAPQTAYTFRMKAVGKGLSSAYTADATIKTQPVEISLIDVETYSPDLTWSADDGVWNYTSPLWKADGEPDSLLAFTDTANVLFAPDTAIHVVIEENVEPKNVVVNSASDIVFSGDKGIAGHGGVTKAGTGVLTVCDNNSYSSATVLNEGVFRFGSLKNGGQSSGIGASEEFAQYWVWNGGEWDYTGGNTSTNRSSQINKTTTFRISNGATVTMNGSLEGEGGVVLAGNGQLTAADYETFFKYSGPTRLEGGKLYFACPAGVTISLGLSSGLELAGGTLQTKGDNSGYETYDFPISVAEGTVSTLQVHRNCYMKNAVSGKGTLLFEVPYVREYIQGDWSGFTGRLIAKGNGSDKDGSQLLLNNSKGIPNATVELQGNTQVVCWKNAQTLYLGGLSGSSSTALCGADKKNNSATMKWIVGGANTDETFDGVIDNRCSSGGYNGKTSVEKIGTGDWRLNGKNIHSGTTTVDGGRLIVNGQLAGAGDVIVNNGGTLAGKGQTSSTGIIAGRVTVNSGGILAVGDTAFNNKDVLTLSKGVIVNKGGKIKVPLYKKETLNKAPQFKLNANSTIKGTLVLDMENVTVDIVPNSSFQLFSLAKGIVLDGALEGIEPAIPQEGMQWDTSQLFSTGKIYVRTDEYMTHVKSLESYPDHVEYYTLDGQKSVAIGSAKSQLLIERTVKTDGSVSVNKVYVK